MLYQYFTVTKSRYTFSTALWQFWWLIQLNKYKISIGNLNRMNWLELRRKELLTPRQTCPRRAGAPRFARGTANRQSDAAEPEIFNNISLIFCVHQYLMSFENATIILISCCAAYRDHTSRLLPPIIPPPLPHPQLLISLPPPHVLKETLQSFRVLC